MRDAQVTALREAADAGVDCDGLHAERTDDGYAFETPDARHEGLGADDFERVARDHPAYVTNWYAWSRDYADADRAFLRWVEYADEGRVPEKYDALRDGITRTWGEVAVTATLGENGARRYRLSHEDDVDASDETLDVHGDPLDARHVVKHDDDGRYRPLKTAPTLPHGWAFVGLDGRECARAVDLIYPATITNWHLEREDELDVDHWEETVDRQTGIYGVVQTWNRGEGHEHVNWVAEACCDDSQCLKRREWQYDEDTALDVDGGDGTFPCREPCSLVIAAARTWTRIEGEEERTYEFELTPSEKEQLEEILDAVADGRAGDVREADVKDGANRYRARFLRAKRVDDAGNLCGVPTDDE
ncbi:DR2241 family protein [Halorarius halobius]|uniref:DR2241 family protein n=1 Tax=Halorarius halobius TaxID=2962671 RepID=UPI0020CBDF45|nr:DR2241 family protein [Halorarius halobius]